MSGSAIQKYATLWFGLAARGIYPATMLQVLPIPACPPLSDMHAAGNVFRGLKRPLSEVS